MLNPHSLLSLSSRVWDPSTLGSGSVGGHFPGANRFVFIYSLMLLLYGLELMAYAFIILCSKQNTKLNMSFIFI